MNSDGRHFRIEAILEAPLWVLVTVFALITVAVIASGIGVL